MRRSLAVSLFLVFALSITVTAQAVSTAAPTSDPQALTLAAAAISALTGGQQISDVRLTGIAKESAGGYSGSGVATFKARGYSEASYDNRGTSHREIRNQDSSGTSQGVSSSTDGTSHPIALHNTWTDSAWFFPALSSLAVVSRPGMVANYVGQETRNGVAVQHLRLQQYVTGQTARQTSLIAQLSREDIYLDATSLLPVALTFQTHPDSDLNTNIPVEVDFSNYQAVNGVQVPFHIQKHFYGQPSLDFQVSNAAVNTGLGDSDFAIQ